MKTIVRYTIFFVKLLLFIPSGVLYLLIMPFCMFIAAGSLLLIMPHCNPREFKFFIKEMLYEPLRFLNPGRIIFKHKD